MFLLMSLVLLFTGGCRGILLDDGAELTVAGVRAMKQQMDAFNRTVEGLKKDLSALKASSVRVARQAFMVRLSKDTTPGPNQPIIYDKVLVDLDNNYDPRHGTFTAKINGTYLFTVEACSSGTHYIHLALLKNFTEMGTILGGDDSYADCSSNTFIFPLVENDDVWVQHKTGGDLLAANWNGNNFAGVLINPA